MLSPVYSSSCFLPDRLLENLGGKHGIASCCADSLSIRSFLGNSLTEATPDHS